MRIAEISVHGCPMRPVGGRDTGGMNVYLRELSAELGKLGAWVDVFTRRHDCDEPDVMALSDRVRLVHIAAGDPEDVSKTGIYAHLPDFLRNLRYFHGRNALGYDVVHSHYWLSTPAAQQFSVEMGVPHVITFHTLGEVKNQARPAEMEPPLRFEVERKAIALSDAIIAFTIEEGDNLVHTYGAHRDKIKVIPCGVDVSLFRPLDRQKARSELGIGADLKVLLFAGRPQPFKGVDLLLHALSCLDGEKNLRLLVVGGDSESEVELARLRSLARELCIEDSVAFLGAVEHERMPIFYNAADVCAVPSYHESFGLVAVEAMACSTPVVASRVGGLVTTVEHGKTGFLVEERSGEAFANALRTLLKDEKLRRRMGQEARSSALRFDWTVVARRVLGVYQELASANPSLVPQGGPAVSET